MYPCLAATHCQVRSLNMLSVPKLYIAIMNANSHQKKQIAPGIFLKKFIPHDAANMYVFEVEVQRLNIVEFECDFTGSENIVLKDMSGLKCLKTIEPFESSIVATLELHKDWKLKSKFRFTLKSPSKEMQTQWILTQNKTIKSYITNAETMFKGTEPTLMSIEQINAELEKANSKYLDLDFIPDEVSLIGKEDRTLLDATVTQWRRPEKFLKAPFELFARIHPNNIMAGKLDDEAFFSVLRCMAIRPPLIERLFLSPTQVNLNGVYRLRICKNGEWQSVTIDDSIPCEPISHPKFTRSSEADNDLWPMLIEKAYAKLHRSYFSLRELEVKDIFEDLTGCPTEVLQIEDTPAFHKTISESFAQSFIVSFYNLDQIKEFEEDEFTPISKRAYSMTKFKEGMSEISILADTGEISLTFAELRQKFSYVCICKTRNWEEIRIKGKFLAVKHARNPDHISPVSRWYYTFDIQLQSTLNISLHQEDIHIGCNKQFKPYLWVSLVIFKKTPESGLKRVGLVPFSNSRMTSINLELDVGSYLVVPVTLSDLEPTDKMEEEQLVYDIFRKLDLLMNRELKYAELVPLFKAVKHPFNQEEYLALLKKYSKTKAIGPKAFGKMWKENKMLWYPEISEFSESRLFIFSIHSAHELSVLVKDNVGTDLDNLAHIEIISNNGKEKQFSKEAKLTSLKHANHFITYYVQNDHVSKIDIELDCSTSEGYLFNPPSGKVSRQLDSGQREYVMKLIPNLSGDLNFVKKETLTIKALDS